MVFDMLLANTAFLNHVQESLSSRSVSTRLARHQLYRGSVAATGARNEGLPFADVLTEANILDVLNDHGVKYRDRMARLSASCISEAP
jgi:hypothetical protein